MTRRSPSPEATSDPTPSQTESQTPTTDPETTSLLFHPPVSPSPDPLLSPESPLSSDPSPSYVGDDASPSAPRSTPADWRKKRRQLLEPAKGAVQTVGGVAHTILTAEGTPEREHGLYLPDEDDVQAIAEPLAGLASRRMPEGAENPDIADLIALAMGVAMYVVKQVNLKAQLRRLFRPEPQTMPEPDEVPGGGE